MGYDLWRRVLPDASAPDGGLTSPRDQEVLLLANLKRRRARAEEPLARCTGHWGYEDPVYRFYHQSYAALLHLFDLR